MELNRFFFAEHDNTSNLIFEKNGLENFIYFKDITINLIDNILYSNKTFVNRLDDENLTTKESFQNLLDSIKKIDLLHPIYLLEKNKNNYIIVSGWRRFHALKEIYKVDKNKIFFNKAIILKKETPLEILETISINENTKRKDLTLLELSYKFNKLAARKGVTIEECLKQFNIGKSQFYAIKKAIDFHPLIKGTMLETVGAIKADLLNKILEKLLVLYPKNKAQSLLFEYSKKSKDDLKDILKSLDEDTNQNNSFEIKKNSNITILKIKEDLTEEHHLKIRVFFKELFKNR
ncbi:ParB/RepB/Spo0J family partition protein [Cetobacterium sp.]|uniref:ParB/RepB/Spo0J family partition protein n=1 Tax=Cetobacterium sp. TaxID=2071632 RepID=UPI003F33C506